MAKKTSADCVAFLVEKKGGKQSEWKRRTKKKGADDSWVRFFENTESGDLVIVVEDSDGNFKLIDSETPAVSGKLVLTEVDDDFSGRIIYSPAEDEDEERLFFYCGPETKDKALHDSVDGGTTPQLEALFKDMDFTPWESENMHSVSIPEDSDAETIWDIVENRLKAAGAIRQDGF
jgi:hypothetical protein